MNHDAKMTSKTTETNEKHLHRARFKPETFHLNSVSNVTHKFI